MKEIVQGTQCALSERVHSWSMSHYLRIWKRSSSCDVSSVDVHSTNYGGNVEFSTSPSKNKILKRICEQIFAMFECLVDMLS